MMEMTNKAKILVLYANPYDMITEEKEHLVGVSIQYLFWGENGEALVCQSEWNPLKPVGVQRGKCSMEKSFRERVVIAPAIYEATFEMGLDGNGKAVSKIIDIHYLSHVKFEPYKIGGLQIPGMIVEEPKTEPKQAEVKK